MNTTNPGPAFIHLLDMVFLYTRLAINRETAHTLNNYITTLSMQQALIAGSVQSLQDEKLTGRMAKLREAIQRLQALSAGLVTEISIPANPVSGDIRRIIKDTFEYLLEYPGFKNCRVEYDLCAADQEYQLDRDGLQVLCFCFLSQAVIRDPNPRITIQSLIRPESREYCLIVELGLADARVAEAQATPTPLSVGHTLGAIPLHSFQRILPTVNRAMQLQPGPAGTFGFTLTLSPSGN